MKKPIIVINKHARDYAGYINLGIRVHEMMMFNSHFVDPSPSLPVLFNAVEEAAEASALWKHKGNYGSKQNLIDLRVKTVVLAQLLKAMTQYVQNTALLIAGNDYALMTAIMVSSGFELKKAKSPQGVLSPVVNLRRLISASLRLNEVKFKWEKPYDVRYSINVKLYKVYRGLSPQFSEATVIATISRTTFLDCNPFDELITYWYWIVPVGTAGDGVPSGPFKVKLPGI